jgi:hypothetical protein
VPPNRVRKHGAHVLVLHMMVPAKKTLNIIPVMSCDVHVCDTYVCMNTVHQLTAAHCRLHSHARYCSAACQKSAWRGGHKAECESLQRVAPHTPPSAVILTAAALRRGDGSLAPELARLAGGSDDVDDGAKEKLAALVAMLREFMREGELDDSRTAFELLCKVRRNVYSICDDELQSFGAGVYPVMAAANHSCAPNCVATFRRAKLELRAMKSVAKGEELTISYVVPRTNLLQRE